MNINKTLKNFVALRPFAPSWLRLSAAFAVVAAFSLFACESDFITDPTRPRPTRAVQSPYVGSSANGEAMGPATGTVPLLVVRLPNTKDEKAKVRTIFDPPESNSQASAATRPATQPADPNAPSLASLPVRIIQQQKPEDQFALATNADGDLLITITSPSGIGNAMLERTGDAWPATVLITLQHADQKPFSVLEGFTAAEAPDDTRRLTLKSTIHKAEGRAEVSIPPFARSSRITLSWIDVYR